VDANILFNLAFVNRLNLLGALSDLDHIGWGAQRGRRAVGVPEIESLEVAKGLPIEGDLLDVSFHCGSFPEG
jgi:hypothetical protein